jgi:hypothetical protein
MSEQQVIALIESLLKEFFAKDPVVEEIIAIAPDLLKALSDAKSGKAFELPVLPLTLAGKAGKVKLGWAPDAA